MFPIILPNIRGFSNSRFVTFSNLKLSKLVGRKCSVVIFFLTLQTIASFAHRVPKVEHGDLCPDLSQCDGFVCGFLLSCRTN